MARNARDLERILLESEEDHCEHDISGGRNHVLHLQYTGLAPDRNFPRQKDLSLQVNIRLLISEGNELE